MTQGKAWVIKDERRTATRLRNATGETAEALLAKGRAADERIVQALQTYAALVSEAGVKYDRELLVGLRHSNCQKRTRNDA